MSYYTGLISVPWSLPVHLITFKARVFYLILKGATPDSQQKGKINALSMRCS